MAYVGKYTYAGTVKKFLSESRDTWLQSMTAQYPEVSPHILGDSQIRAWEECYWLLREVLQQREDYQKLQIVFEYVMPTALASGPVHPDDRGRRADVILLSNDTLVILEFKRYAQYWEGLKWQPILYRKRLQRRHKQSMGMKKNAILLLTKANDLWMKEGKLAISSPEYFAPLLAHYFPVPIQKMPKSQFRTWLDSSWDRPKKGKAKHLRINKED